MSHQLALKAEKQKWDSKDVEIVTLQTELEVKGISWKWNIYHLPYTAFFFGSSIALDTAYMTPICS